MRHENICRAGKYYVDKKFGNMKKIRLQWKHQMTITALSIVILTDYFIITAVQVTNPGNRILS